MDSNKRIIIVTNPADDIATRYLDSWSKRIFDLVKSKQDTEIFEIREHNTTRDNLTKLINEKKPHFVVVNGHGDEKSLAGFRQEILIRCDLNEQILDGRIIHSMSCGSAKLLGPKCISYGSLAYIGYTQKFHFFHTNKSTEKEQLNDQLADFFLLPLSRR